MDKMTYGKALAFVLDNCDLPEDVHERINALSVSLAKKNSAERKPTAQQTANIGFRDQMFKFLALHAGSRYTITEIIAGCDLRTDDGMLFSTPRGSALMRELMNEHPEVLKVVDKRRSYFTVEKGE